MKGLLAAGLMSAMILPALAQEHDLTPVPSHVGEALTVDQVEFRNLPPLGSRALHVEQARILGWKSAPIEGDESLKLPEIVQAAARLSGTVPASGSAAATQLGIGDGDWTYAFDGFVKVGGGTTFKVGVHDRPTQTGGDCVVALEIGGYRVVDGTIGTGMSIERGVVLPNGWHRFALMSVCTLDRDGVTIDARSDGDGKFTPVTFN
ncbi:hypothetical protein [Bradyrhizobium elkanii]|uniref:hypothetical protein n=1 Tax=Bradyrhizobium elkanii TaxID=29448 RepID=UPI003519127D